MDTVQTFKNLLGIPKKKETVGFMDMVKTQLTRGENNVAYTANGAKVYRTSGKELLDLNFSVSAMRNAKEQEIYDLFMKAFYEDPVLAMKWLFYLRDTRLGMGERRSFKVIVKHLADVKPELITPLIPLFAEYGRYDDMLVLMDTDLEPVVLQFVKAQLIQDLRNMEENKPITLLAKWLPSVNTKVEKTRQLAKRICSGIGLDEETYRKTLSALRKYANVVEVDLSAKRWSAIDYNKVPSKANLKYNAAFLRNDEERRRHWLAKLQAGDKDVKINASTLFPYEIVNSYCRKTKADPTLEELWKALPDTVNGASNVMVVADGSGSMRGKIDFRNSSVTYLDVANSLAIYFSERCTSLYKDRYITFSTNPKYVDFSQAKTLFDKVDIAERHNECSSTNIQKVFELILDTAVTNNLNQEQIPGTVLVVSDMQFNGCVFGGNGKLYEMYPANINLFEYIQKEYEDHGYKMPKCVFWNVAGRMQGTVPMIQNEMGVVLVSGFSTSIAKMVLSNETDPYKTLVQQLNTERYNAVGKIVKEVLDEK